MDRRGFLRMTGIGGSAAVLGGVSLPGCQDDGGDPDRAERRPQDRT